MSRNQLWLAVLLLAFCPLLTGCPHNDYTVELTPQTNGIQRTLTFYRTDEGGTKEGVTVGFPANQLAAIEGSYPAGSVTQSGQKYAATGIFNGRLPDDVGGAGSYTNYVTTLGNAGFYVERFREGDDLMAGVARRTRAADQITDLVMGWSKAELGRDPGYRKLRRFLDQDFRNDLKNAGLYFWTGGIRALSDTNALEEFTVRFYQYLFERGYVKLADLPALYSISGDDSDSAILHMVRRLTMEKMGLPASGPLPTSFAVLNDPAAFEKSWEKYLARTDLYQAKVKEWEQQKKSDPKLEPPKPQSIMDDLFADLLFRTDGETDRLTVRLALAQAPNHTNGKWQEGQVSWTTDLDPSPALPVICYAIWSHPEVDFQNAHLGGVLLEDEELTQYCLWRSTLADGQGREWDIFLAGLQPGPDLKQKLENFEFRSVPPPVNGQADHLDTGSKLLLAALSKETGASPTGLK